MELNREDTSTKFHWFQKIDTVSVRLAGPVVTAMISEIVLSSYLSRQSSISTKFGMQMWILIPLMVRWWIVEVLHSRLQLRCSVKEPNKHHNYETEKTTLKASVAAEDLQL